ncbi:hypothetical protein [Micromonospora sp. NBC_01796]|uniref:hypothetical protein n=1 Tax=Micromonospora sp. NBC_01796 TaxID=2975987 RepID=UPI002DD97104|nr:hypothetical protein [Micromonospora sp. NBC_01796]WSA87072.1 hypothetical protein OIE47_05475 [Micromonospora sp. NBC_01796]
MTEADLRDLVVALEPGEWYARFGVLAATPRCIRLVHMDGRLYTRWVGERGEHAEVWVSAHKPECQPGHPPCLAEYVALAAVERAVAGREAR